MTLVLLTMVAVLAAEAFAACNLNVNFAQFLHENRICETSTGWVRGPYSCLCLNGALAGCLPNSACSFITSCQPLQRCSVDDFVKCQPTLQNLQGLDCSSTRHCQVVRLCRPVLLKRSVCINGTQGNEQRQFQPLGINYGRFSPLQDNLNRSNDVDLVGNDTLPPDDETDRPNATNVTSINVGAPVTVKNDTNLTDESTPENNATDISTPNNNETDTSLNETLAPGGDPVQNRTKTTAPICWIERSPALHCRNVTRCYPRSQCIFRPTYVNLTICKQNSACQEPTTCQRIWMCNQKLKHF